MSAYKFNVTPQEVPEVQTKFREIKTQIPAPGTAEILERLNKLVVFVTLTVMKSRFPISIIFRFR